MKLTSGLLDAGTAGRIPQFVKRRVVINPKNSRNRGVGRKVMGAPSYMTVTPLRSSSSRTLVTNAIGKVVRQASSPQYDTYRERSQEM